MMPDRAGQASSIRNYRLVPSLFSRRLKLRFQQPHLGNRQTYQNEVEPLSGTSRVKDLGKGLWLPPNRTNENDFSSKGTNTSECGF
jgi:hypothetical protein